MPLLKRSSLFLLLIFFVSCTSSSQFRVLNGVYDTEFILTPDRFIAECEYISDENPTYGLVAWILDEENTVSNLMSSQPMPKKDCFKALAAYQNMLDEKKEIYLGVTGSIMPREKTEKWIEFPGKGKFRENGRLFTLQVMATQSGKCFDLYSESKKPCPSDPFPTKPINWTKK